MRAAVLVNAYIRAPGMVRQAERMAEELRLLGVETDIVKNGTVSCFVHENAITYLKKYDVIVYLDKDKYLSRMLEKCGMRLFNRAESVELCDDKMLTCIALSDGGVNIPDTVAAPLCYYKDACVPCEFLESVVQRLGYPVIVKTSFGSWGDGVRKADNFSELAAAAEAVRMRPHLFQKCVGKRGEDYRVIVVGGKVIAQMRRKNEGDFRSNIEAGGKGSSVCLPENFLQTAVRCAEILHLDYCGVDLLDENGIPYVCEVNSNAMFNEAERVTGVNVAAAWAKHIVASMNE